MRKYQYESSFHNDDGPKGGSQGLPYVAPKKGDYRYGKFMATNRKKKDDIDDQAEVAAIAAEGWAMKEAAMDH